MEIQYAELMKKASGSMNSRISKGVLDYLSEVEEYNSPFEIINLILKNDFRHIFSIKQVAIDCSTAILLLILINIFKDAFRKVRIYETVNFVFTVFLFSPIIVTLYSMLNTAVLYIKDISTFIGVISPTVGILAASGGNLSYAKIHGVFFSLLLGASQILLNSTIPMVISVFFVLAIVDSFTGTGKLMHFSQLLKNAFFGIFAIATALFFIIVNTYGETAKISDTASSKALRLLIGNAIPIIGGTISDSLKVLGGSIATVKNRIGIGGVVFILTIYLPVLVLLWISGMLLNLVAFLCDYFSIWELKRLVLHMKYMLDFTLAGLSSIVVASLINISTFISTFPVVMI